jgi:pentatricopeptide repeat protein
VAQDVLVQAVPLASAARRGLTHAPRFALNEALELLHKSGWVHALRLLLWMESSSHVAEQPNEHTYAAFLAGCGAGPSLAAARSLWQRLTVGGALPAERVCRALLGVLARAGELLEAEELLLRMEWDELPQQLQSFNLVLAGCARDGQWPTALRVWQQLCASAAAPNAHSLTLMLRAADGGAAWAEGLAEARGALARGVPLDAVAVGTLVAVAGRAGDGQAACEAWACGRRAGLLLRTAQWNARLFSLAWLGDAAGARELLSEMRRTPAAAPDARSYTALAEAERRDSAAADTAQRVAGVRAALAALAADGLVPEEAFLTVLLTALGDAGLWAEARVRAQQWRAHRGVPLNAIHWNCLIRACGCAGKGDAALRAFRDMQAAGVIPTRATFALLFAALPEEQREVRAELLALRASLQLVGVTRDELADARAPEEPAAPEHSFAPGSIAAWALEAEEPAKQRRDGEGTPTSTARGSLSYSTRARLDMQSAD